MSTSAPSPSPRSVIWSADSAVTDWTSETAPAVATDAANPIATATANVQRRRSRSSASRPTLRAAARLPAMAALCQRRNMPEPFQPRVDHSATPAPGALVFGFLDGRLAVEETTEGVEVPDYERVRDRISGDALFLGTLESRDCFVAALDASAELAGLSLYGLRELFGRLPDHMASLAGRASQMLEWSLAHAYCGRCGTATETAS